MDGLLFLLAIVYMIVSAAGSKNKKQKQEAAKKARQAFETAQSANNQAQGGGVEKPQPAPARQARPATKQPMPRRFPEDFQQAARTLLTQKANQQQVTTPAADSRPEARPLQEGESATSIRRTPIESRLTQIQATQRHTLEASSLTGHAHEESSLSGVQEDCITPRKRASISQGTEESSPRIASSLPVFNADTARLGILYGEILGKPKALRR